MPAEHTLVFGLLKGDFEGYALILKVMPAAVCGLFTGGHFTGDYSPNDY